MPRVTEETLKRLSKLITNLEPVLKEQTELLVRGKTTHSRVRELVIMNLKDPAWAMVEENDEGERFVVPQAIPLFDQMKALFEKYHFRLTPFMLSDLYKDNTKKPIASNITFKKD